LKTLLSLNSTDPYGRDIAMRALIDAGHDVSDIISRKGFLVYLNMAQQSSGYLRNGIMLRPG